MGGRRTEDGRPSNLQCFLDCTTPTVNSHILPKTNGRSSTDAWHHAETDSVEYFSLADLWEQYYEWSAYGAGVPVQLPGGDKVVQYYVPYLSGMQLYTNKTLSASRSFGEDYGVDFWSDDEDNEKMSRSWSSTSEDSLFNSDVAGSNRKRPGHLHFEFFEVCSPYRRIPLTDKVYELSQDFSGLTSLKSIDLSPASWMSVAWYPIYHIPYQCNVKDLSACFLTYHTISFHPHFKIMCQKRLSAMAITQLQVGNKMTIWTGRPAQYHFLHLVLQQAKSMVPSGPTPGQEIIS